MLICFDKKTLQGLKDSFKAHDKYVVQWDGKMFNDMAESKFMDRLAFVLTVFGTEQLLGVLKMSSGTAENQASPTLSTLNEWGISRYIKAMCFDTNDALFKKNLNYPFRILY